MHRFVVASVLFVVACNNTPPEGVYPCRQLTVAHDCPALWYCRRDNFCWITDDPDAGTTAGDAAMSLPDAGVDAARDIGPHCTTEICNGMDDDCDGLVDEGVITVGPAVVATTGAHDDGARMVPTENGFRLVVGESSTPSPLDSVTIDSLGRPLGPAAALGTDLQRQYPIAFEVAQDASRLFVVSLIDDGHATLVIIDLTSGERLFGTPVAIPVPAGTYAPAALRFGHVNATEVAIYGMFVSIAGADASPIRRIVFSLGSVASVVEDMAIVSDSETSNGWGVLATTSGEFLAYETADACFLMRQPLHGATGTLGLVTRLADDCGYYVAMDIRDPSSALSALNPLGIAWQSLDEPLTFVEVTSTTSSLIGAPVVLADSNGAYRDPFAPPNLVSLRALPSAGPGAGHWLLANVDQATGVDPNTAFAAVQLREIIGSGAVVHRLDVPGETAAARSDIEIARGVEGIRLAERANDMGVVTRAIGCE